jgi:hypothetical protein
MVALADVLLGMVWTDLTLTEQHKNGLSTYMSRAQATHR